jgi:hypothetical protein
MAQAKRHIKLLEKSVAALLSAIEIYNKPDFKYREEIFSILFVNSWELLLKAKILKDNKEKLISIQVPEKTKTKTGKPIQRFYPKVNRSGNPLTIDIFKAIDILKMSKTLKANLEAIVEIRDNSIHFKNEDRPLAKRIQEICTASLRSYLELLKNWFSYDISDYNFYLVPITFFHPYEIESYSLNSLSTQEKNLIKYLKSKEKQNPYKEDSEHHFSLTLTTKFEKGSSGLNVKISKRGVPIRIQEENLFKTKYIIDSLDLQKKVKQRYSNVKINNKFWGILKGVKENNNFCRYNYLDPIKKTGTKKPFYCSEIFKELDKYYLKK